MSNQRRTGLRRPKASINCLDTKALANLSAFQKSIQQEARQPQRSKNLGKRTRSPSDDDEMDAKPAKRARTSRSTTSQSRKQKTTTTRTARKEKETRTETARKKAKPYVSSKGRGPMTMARARERIKELKQERDEAVEESEDLNEQLNAIREEMSAVQGEHLKEVSALQQELNEKRTAFERERSENANHQMQLNSARSDAQTKESQLKLVQDSMNNLNQQISTLQQTIDMKESMYQSQLSEKEMFKSQVDMMRTQCESQMRQINDQSRTINSLRETVSSSQTELSKAMTENMSLKLHLESSQHQCESQAMRISELTQANAGLQSTVELNSGSMTQLRAEITSHKAQIEALETDGTNLRREIAEHKKTIAGLEEQIVEYDARARRDEETRKRMHNTIQELKGNIRVYCRVRPLLKDGVAIAEDDGDVNDENADTSNVERKTNDPSTRKHVRSVFEFETEDIEHQQIELRCAETTNYAGQAVDGKRYNFTFDHVFRPHDAQESVFEEISQLVQSALDGYKVCIFAYGQTGSGKTYTMEGPSLNPSDDRRGMIPRSVELIFAHAVKLSDRGWRYDVSASFLEIYNEKIRDLLSDDPEAAYLELQQRNRRNYVEVPNLTIVPVSGSEDVYPLLDKASKSRATASTDCNERSSRSHSVFQLYLSGHNEVTKQEVNGVLNLIDLAGSERLKKSNAAGQQLKEAQNINRSLACLGDVIGALANKSKHIPYRNSKLTHLLMNHFGGESKTLMFVNLCPEDDRVDESLCSLRFAAKVNDCQIGVARRNVG